MNKISIIIPCKKIDSMTEKCVEKCLNLNYDNFEIIVLPDNPEKDRFVDKKIKTIGTGEVRPAFKRNIGMKNAEGDFFAFIDSDAYPREDWLKNAIKYFNEKKIGIVGGPNLTPPEGNFWEKVSGHVLSNFFVSGKADIRYKIAENQFTHELPSCNYLSRREASSEYKPDFLTAEDSEFCFSCKRKEYGILYAGDVVVYHHRRDSFAGHLKQMWVYGRDIAWLSKEDLSWDKIYYSALTIFSIGFILLLIGSFFNNIVNTLFLYWSLIYILIMAITGAHENAKTTLAVLATSILTHFAYGFGWLYGILSKKKLRVGKR